ncbi:Maf family protein [Kribbella sp. NBC_01484]|uniref:Maf family protein n=1 Tax=Kribbella sp. NBC_01484 TaxID=2903579 RepID=UPI002E349F77|nr:Maf family protein [Kribbella sp. NBC_01484]
MKLVLASGSPRRKEILSDMGLEFTINPSHCDESVDPGTSPSDAVCELAIRKASTVAAGLPDSLVIGSDTVIDLAGEIIGKPHTPEQAAATLRALSGRTHIVRTAVAMVNSNDMRSEVTAAEAQIEFRDLSDDEINAYVATGEPMDKAGAYAIQGEGSSLIAKFSGDEDTIIGLPRQAVKELLARF